MSFRTLLSVIFICITFLACEDEKNINFSIINITTANNKLADVNIPHASGDEMVSNAINNEINNIVSTSLQIGENTPSTNKTIEESISNFNEEFQKFLTDFPESINPWEAQIDGEILYDSPEIISLSITSYVNTGGAHGSVNISFLNFDAVTGKRIQNSKLFKNLDAFKSLAQQYFNESIEDKTILFNPEKFELPQNIGFSEDGLILLYNTYEIAPYSAGIIEFKIPADKVNELLSVYSPY